MKQDVERAYQAAGERYAELGVDTETALERLRPVSLSVHCWQGDDVGGFETADRGLSGGGIQVTGSYPGKPRTLEELRADLAKMYCLLPGTHRLALHAIYGDFGGKKVDRDHIASEHFAGWADWAGEQRVRLDFNSTLFSHPLAASGFTLSSKDPKVRRFWVEHVRRCREVSAYLGRRQGDACIDNLWIADGAKDFTVDRAGYRRILLDSLDECFAQELPETETKDAVEGKLFGIGSESFVVGSHEFYLGYALSRRKLLTVDLGHFHPTESVADKISSLFCYLPELLLHVSRPVRWDSDHVVVLDDPVRALFEEIVRGGYLGSTRVGLDFFDGSMNRIGAWAIGARSALKGLLLALLEPRQRLLDYEEAGDAFARLALLEELKALPFGAVWDHYCASLQVPLDRELIAAVHAYEREVTAKRR
jgi:L-rhamnose isomerase